MRRAGPRRWRTLAAEAYTIRFRPTAPLTSPRHLQIEIITRCNLACVMCPRTVALSLAGSTDARAKWFEAMPLDRYTRILDQASGTRSLSLHGLGEPLLHPNLVEFVEQAVARDIQVRLTTNLTLLTPERTQRFIRSGLDRLIVSLDGASAETYESIRVHASFEKVIANLKGLLAARRALNAARPRVDVNMVVGAANQYEVAAMVRLCHRLGVDGLILSPVKPANASVAPLLCPPDAWDQYIAAARQEAQRLSFSLHVRGHVGPGTDAPRAERHKETWRCRQPWLSSMVEADGSVMPCCNIHDRQHALGNILTEEFREIWAGRCYRSFREALKRPQQVPAPCAHCPDF